MPRILSIFILALLPSIVYAQNDTTYFSSDMTPTQWSFASYYRVIYPNQNNNVKVVMYYINDKPKSITNYNNIDSAIKNGQSVAYDKAGHITDVENFNHGRRNGKWDKYYINSDTLFSSIYYDNDKVDSLFSYYPDGKLKRIEKYNKAAGLWDTTKLLSGQCFDEAGKPITYTPYSTSPQPSVDITQFVAQNVRIPRNALSKPISGRVIVRFVIEADGSMDNFFVLKSLRKDMDDEFIKVLKSAPRWIPGKLDGKPAPMDFVMPLTYQM